MKKKATKAGKAKAGRKRSATKDLSARKAVTGGLLPYIEQDNLVTGATLRGGPHVVPTPRTLGR